MHVPEKACPGLNRGGDRFSDKGMRHSICLERVPIPTERDTLQCREPSSFTIDPGGIRHGKRSKHLEVDGGEAMDGLDNSYQPPFGFHERRRRAFPMPRDDRALLPDRALRTSSPVVSLTMAS